MQISDNELPSLELLRCFAMLHRERHLSRAAARAGLSQPAMSRMLAKLRTTFEDPLFVRTPAGMIPTTRADALAPQIAAIVAATSALVKPATFDPNQLSRTFSIVTAGFTETQILPILIDELATEAPGVTVSVRAMTGRDAGSGQLQGGADVLITVKLGLPHDAKRVLAHEESYASAMRADHPCKRLTLDRYCELAHVMVSPSDTAGGVIDSALAALGRTRRVVVRVPMFALAPPIVGASDLVLTGPKLALLAAAPHYNLRLHACPLEIPTFGVYLAWHPRTDGDPASKWFRQKVLAALRKRTAS